MTTVISVENLSKSYRLGQIGTGTFAHDLNVWWAKMRGKPNPLLRIGETDHGNRDGEEIWALKDVSFTVEQGEVLGIIGRNGAGKSTLLKILSRVTAPTSGRIKVKGRVASLLEVGTGFHPELTGRENVYLNGTILGMSRKEIDRKFDEIVDFSGVEKFIDTPVKRYSSGMYVRLAFAVAAHLDPEILVVDEVLAVGDAEFQKKCLGKMSDVAQEGRTVLFVSHNMGAIRSLCSKAIYFDVGNIADIGETNDVVSSYLVKVIDYGKSENPVVIENRMRTKGTGEVRVIEVGLENISGVKSQEFLIWENIRISMSLQNHSENFQELNCWFSVVTPENEIIGTSIQYDGEKGNITIPPFSICRVTAELVDNVLSPGTYFLYVGVLGKHLKIYDWSQDVISFQIHPVFYNRAQYDNRIGKLLFRSIWNILND